MYVSIIIPCYRQAHLLPTAIESALSQTHEHCEIIVVNDGSDDHTDEVAYRYRGQIRYVEKSNGGLPSARNAGLQASSGDLSLFLDADDALDQNAVAAALAATDCDGSSVAVMGHRYFVNTPIETGGIEYQPSIHEDPVRLLIQANLGPPHSYLLPTTLVHRVGGFDTTLTSCEDWDCWLRIALTGARFVAVPRIGAFYRNTPDSMSKNRVRMLRMRSEVLLRFQKSIVQDMSLVTKYGELLQHVERRVIRRFVAQEISAPDITAKMTAAIAELAQLGVPDSRSAFRRVADRILGEYADRLAIRYFSLCDRSMLQYYQNGIS